MNTVCRASRVRKILDYLVASMRKAFGIRMERRTSMARKVLKIGHLVWNVEPFSFWYDECSKPCRKPAVRMRSPQSPVLSLRKQSLNFEMGGNAYEGAEVFGSGNRYGCFE